MTALGYEHLRQSLELTAFAPERPALLKPVTRIEPTASYLAIPRHAAPPTDDPVAHLLFALKQEGTNLQMLAQALQFAGRVPEELFDFLETAARNTAESGKLVDEESDGPLS